MNRQQSDRTGSPARKSKAILRLKTIHLFVFLLMVSSVGGAASMPQEQRQVRLLEPGKPIQQELASGQSHSYQIRLAAGQFLRVIAEQQGIDVVVALFGAEGKMLSDGNTDKGRTGPENLWYLAESDCDCRLEIRPVESNAAAGRYEVKITDLRAPTNDDRAAVEMFETMKALFRLPKGQFDKAIPLFEKAMAMLEKLLGPDHPNLLTAIDPLAHCYFAMGDLARAEALYNRSLAIQEKALGPDHLNLIEQLNNLARLAEARGDFARVVSINERQIRIYEKAKGPDHRDVAASLTYLGSLYFGRRDYAQAEPLFHRALAIYEKSLGPEHPEIATVLLGLAKVSLAGCDLARAEQLFKRALTIREKSLGSEHEEVKEVRQDLVDLDLVKTQRAKERMGSNRRKVSVCR